jgi:glutathione-specific gamma-glutamylcyclotransferase
MDEFWVFGYGSLMWNPGFAFERCSLARLHGYRRALCIRSWVHRGSPERPGLVLGLDRGGSCLGVAFEIAPEAIMAVVEYLRARELVTNVYLERSLSVTLADGRRVRALTYVVDRCHVQYAGRMTAQAAAEIVREAVGQSGPNHVYVANTVAHLHDLGIGDPSLEEVMRRVAGAGPVTP